MNNILQLQQRLLTYMGCDCGLGLWGPSLDQSESNMMKSQCPPRVSEDEDESEVQHHTPNTQAPVFIFVSKSLVLYLTNVAPSLL